MTLLSDQGGDRATAYAMSRKVVSLPEGLLCTWLDVNRQNRWCLVGRESGIVQSRGLLGEERKDNHCGAALVHAPDGSVHAVLGGHSSALDHYRLESIDKGVWEHIARIDAAATYPSLVCDHRGGLHLTFRCVREPRWTLDYCAFRDGAWGKLRSLVVAQKPGYVYWTNTIAVGPRGRLHLAFANVRVRPGGTLHYGTSYVSSEDGGETWSDDGARRIDGAPVSVERLALLQGSESSDRIASAAYLRGHAEPGPANREYLQMLLSNVVVDPGGIPHLVCHNGLRGTAELWSHTTQGWRSRPLTAAATREAPGFRVHMQSSLSCDHAGRLHAALMIEPTLGLTWGPSGTRIVRLLVTPGVADIAVEQVCSPDETLAQWLPALEQPGLTPLDHKPALLYTRGVNTGGFSANKNQTATEVWMVQPSPGPTA